MLTDGVPDSAARAAITELAARVAAEDGAPPLSDQTLTQLGSRRVRHVVARDGGTLVGYAQRDGENAELVGEAQVLPDLLEAVLVPGLHVWSHGRHSRLAPLLEQRGFERDRELHQLRRPLDELPDDRPLADGLRLRTFRPSADDAAWLELNAAAFAHHREQGGMRQADLDARMAETWFDPAGFFLAERDGQLLGFHWTKMHPDGAGEVYVLGVAPGTQGLGLGKALLIRGLRHLAARGCEQVLLYVDGDNTTARALYERNGFGPYDLDINWRAPDG